MSNIYSTKQTSRRGCRFRRRIIRIVPAFFLFVTSCIEPYTSDIEKDSGPICIEASLIRGNPNQKITVSIASSLADPVYQPVNNCIVWIEDELNNRYEYSPDSSGAYILEISEDLLVEGRMYKAVIITPEGKEYESEFETLLPGIPVDSVYYQTENKVDAFSGEEITGIRFYVDINAPAGSPDFFRWSVEETYEYTSVGPINYYYMDANLTILVPENPYGLYRCWQTRDIDRIYLSNTVNSTTNEKKMNPLNYVSAETDHLRIKYSLLIEQYMLDENAYKYFEQNKTAAEGEGSLYTGQPENPVTNFCNIYDSEEQVVGYFWASTKTRKRIFITRPEGLTIWREFCYIETFDQRSHGNGPFPMPIMIDITTSEKKTGNIDCFDCTSRGGTTTRPSFWK